MISNSIVIMPFFSFSFFFLTHWWNNICSGVASHLARLTTIMSLCCIIWYIKPTDDVCVRVCLRSMSELNQQLLHTYIVYHYIQSLTHSNTLAHLYTCLILLALNELLNNEIIKSFLLIRPVSGQGGIHRYYPWGFWVPQVGPIYEYVQCNICGLHDYLSHDHHMTALSWHSWNTIYVLMIYNANLVIVSQICYRSYSV